MCSEGASDFAAIEFLDDAVGMDVADIVLDYRESLRDWDRVRERWAPVMEELKEQADHARDTLLPITRLAGDLAFMRRWAGVEQRIQGTLVEIQVWWDTQDWDGHAYLNYGVSYPERRYQFPTHAFRGPDLRVGMARRQVAIPGHGEMIPQLPLDLEEAEVIDLTVETDVEMN